MLPCEDYPEAIRRQNAALRRPSQSQNAALRRPPRSNPRAECCPAKTIQKLFEGRILSCEDHPVQFRSRRADSSRKSCRGLTDVQSSGFQPLKSYQGPINATEWIPAVEELSRPNQYPIERIPAVKELSESNPGPAVEPRADSRCMARQHQ